MCQTIVVDAPVETQAASGSGDLINPIAALAVAFGVGLFAYLRRRRA
jgi:MYXO-CTERM domain-containing protein